MVKGGGKHTNEELAKSRIKNDLGKSYRMLLDLWLAFFRINWCRRISFIGCPRLGGHRTVAHQALGKNEIVARLKEVRVMQVALRWIKA